MATWGVVVCVWHSPGAAPARRVCAERGGAERGGAERGGAERGGAEARSGSYRWVIRRCKR